MTTTGPSGKPVPTFAEKLNAQLRAARVGAAVFVERDEPDDETRVDEHAAAVAELNAGIRAGAAGRIRLFEEHTDDHDDTKEPPT